MNAVEMIDIVKEYPGVLANDHVSLTVREGEIHGLVGENGAGKSTIMNQLYGMQASHLRDHPGLRERGPDPLPQGGHRPGDRHGTPALHAGPFPQRAPEHHSGQPAEEGAVHRPEDRPQAGPGDPGPLCLPAGPGRPGLSALCGSDAAGRDREGPLPGGEDPDPGRAHRRADAPGGGGAHRRSCAGSGSRAAPSLSSPTS